MNELKTILQNKVLTDIEKRYDEYFDTRYSMGLTIFKLQIHNTALSKNDRLYFKDQWRSYNLNTDNYYIDISLADCKKSDIEYDLMSIAMLVYPDYAAVNFRYKVINEYTFIVPEAHLEPVYSGKSGKFIS
jgi:hypothetical protein